MAVARFGRHNTPKRPYGLWVKMTAVVVLGVCFICVWFVFSSNTSVTAQRSSFGRISGPTNVKASTFLIQSGAIETQKPQTSTGEKKVGSEIETDLKATKKDKKLKSGASLFANGSESVKNAAQNGLKDVKERLPRDKTERRGGEEEQDMNDKEEDPDEDLSADGDFIVDNVDGERLEQNKKKKKKKNLGLLLDPKAHYSWKMCATRSRHNYIPCIDIEGSTRRLPGYRHTERSCPGAPPLCLVPLPHGGYERPVHWPDSKFKILYKNVAHPKVAAFIKKRGWALRSGEYISFPHNQSEFTGGVSHYLESIEEMVPDIEWGKNIRVVLDIGCTDASFGKFLLDKEVLTLSLGLKNDLLDLAQVYLERGFPAFVSPFRNRRLPFPSGVFDGIHCSRCSVSWHSNGGKLLLEMNRILRPGGYFILSNKVTSIEDEEAMTASIASICWNVLAHKTDEVSEMGVNVYQKPESNDIYELRRRKNPPLCKENENPDAAWYVPVKTCLNIIPSAIEQRGTEWPPVWPSRLEDFPEWLVDKEKVIADTRQWRAIMNRSYLTGMGIDWPSIRNVMDMTAIYGGFAAALTQQEVWVMNVVPIHAPDTLPVIYERGLFGVYHDWCEPFSTYPRSYDLLHADHLFARLKNRCKLPVAIVVEMDRILRPGGWAIIRDKVEILDPLEGLLRSMHWEIRMTFAHQKEGIICAQKTLWRP